MRFRVTVKLDGRVRDIYIRAPNRAWVRLFVEHAGPYGGVPEVLVIRRVKA